MQKTSGMVMRETLQDCSRSSERKGIEKFQMVENCERILLRISDANYKILIAMDDVTSQPKDFIEFSNKHADHRIIALEVKRYLGNGLEVIVPQIYGEEISR
jgi:hypothetical protein